MVPARSSLMSSIVASRLSVVDGRLLYFIPKVVSCAGLPFTYLGARASAFDFAAAN